MFIYIHFVDVLSMSLMNVMKNNIVWKGRGMAGRNQEFIWRFMVRAFKEKNHGIWNFMTLCVTILNHA